MIGTYRIYKNGVLVRTQSNIITTQGRALILRYLAGNVGRFAGSIAVGTSTVPATAADRKLGFEFTRGDITLAAADVPTSTVIYKASLPMESAGIVNELGVYPYSRLTDAEYSGEVFVSFEPSAETLTGGGTNTTNYRLGKESYNVTASANASTTVSAASTRGNFGGHSPTDLFSLAYFLNDANTNSIAVRLKVDNSNYFQYTVNTAATNGYYISDWAKSSMTLTGAPTWDSITSADFIVSAKSGGSTTVQLDGLRISDNDVYPDYGLVSRAVLLTPEQKMPGEQMDIEYALEFDI